MRECNLKKTKHLTKIGGGLPECKKVFFGSFFGFWWFCIFVSLCFCAFALYTIAQNGYSPAFLEVFRLFCSHKRPVFNCFFSSYFVFVCFCLSFQKSIFSLLFVHQPLFRKAYLWGFFCFSFACPFPFLMFACLLETNFPIIPFLKPKLFSFLAVYFFFCCSCFCVHGVCFSLSVSMLALFLVFLCVCSVFLFLSCFLFCFQSMKKLFFPAILVFFELCWLKG